MQQGLIALNVPSVQLIGHENVITHRRDHSLSLYCGCSSHSGGIVYGVNPTVIKGDTYLPDGRYRPHPPPVSQHDESEQLDSLNPGHDKLHRLLIFIHISAPACALSSPCRWMPTCPDATAGALDDEELARPRLHAGTRLWNDAILRYSIVLP